MIKIDGKEYESEPYSEKQREVITHINNKTFAECHLTWESILNRDKFFPQIIENKCKMGKFELDPRIKLCICSIVKNIGQISVVMVDILETFGVTANLVNVVNQLYSEGWYSRGGAKERWKDLKNKKKSLKWGILL